MYKPYCNQNQSQGPSCYTPTPTVGSPGGAGVKSRLPLQGMWVRALGREDPLEEEWQPTPVFSPGESHGQRSLAGHSPQGHKELDVTQYASAFFTHNFSSSLVAQRLKCLPAMWETWVRSLGREDPLEKEMATHSSILAWRIPWTEEPGRLQSMGSQRVGHD